jgi:hypothetical protein
MRRGVMTVCDRSIVRARSASRSGGGANPRIVAPSQRTQVIRPHHDGSRYSMLVPIGVRYFHCAICCLPAAGVRQKMMVGTPVSPTRRRFTPHPAALHCTTALAPLTARRHATHRIHAHTAASTHRAVRASSSSSSSSSSSRVASSRWLSARY